MTLNVNKFVFIGDFINGRLCTLCGDCDLYGVPREAIIIADMGGGILKIWGLVPVKKSYILW